MAEQKTKKKFPWGMVIYFLCCGVIGGVIGGVLAASDVDLDLNPGMLLGVIVLFLLALYLHIILHEAGHMLFGMATGYKFLSYRVGSFMWEKGADGKVRFSRFSLAGTGGQCLMSPPDYTGDSFPYVWYNLGGGLINLILSVLAGAALLLFPMGKWLSAALWMLLLVGIFLGGTNLLPLPKVNNDGSNLLAISRSADARRAFWLQMKVNEQVAWGTRLRDLPEEYFPVFPQESRSNAMVAAVAVMAASRQLDGLRFDQSREMMLALVDDQNVPGIYRQLMVFDLAWIEIYQGCPGTWVERLQSKEIQQFAKAMKKFPSVLRTQYAAALLIDKDESKAAQLRTAFDKMASCYPHESEIIGERELMDLVAARATEA